MKEIYKALASFQDEVPVIHKGTEGYGYSYASLNSIFEVIKPLLKVHGLMFSQLLEGEFLKTTLVHLESGETIESLVLIDSSVSLAKMNKYQVYGSAITYFRRYSLTCMLGLITDKDIDGGGEPEKAKPILTIAQFEATLTAKEKAVLKVLNEFEMSTEQRTKLKALVKIKGS